MLTVIVPVYKAEAYIDKCIQDILGQTFKDFELLLVLDGSFDKSEEICDRWALQDSRIKVLKEQHAGVAHARQVGLDNAIGEYIMYVDADDEVHPYLLQEMYDMAIEDHADMVICDYTILDNNGEHIRKQKPTSLEPITVIDDMLNGRLYSGLWNKLLRANVLKTSNVKFNMQLSMHEDAVFLYSVIPHMQRISYLPQSLYGYNKRNVSSLTNNYVGENSAYYKQEMLWYAILLDNKYITEKTRTNFIIYNNLLAYITLKSGLFTKGEWYQACEPFREVFKDVHQGYKSWIVSLAMSGHFMLARTFRTILAHIKN